MSDYFFLYKNSWNSWSETTNPKFIAIHQYCRAIPKEALKDMLICDFVYELNSLDYSNNKLIMKIIQEYDIN